MPNASAQNHLLEAISRASDADCPSEVLQECIAGIRTASDALAARVTLTPATPAHLRVTTATVNWTPLPPDAGPTTSTFCGHAATYRELASTRSKSVVGPATVYGMAIGVGHCLVGLVYDQPALLVSLELVLPHDNSSASAREALYKLLEPAAKACASLFLSRHNYDSHLIRVSFYTELLAASYISTAQLYPRLCALWRTACHADLASLWLHNPFTHHWERVCSDGREPDSGSSAATFAVPTLTDPATLAHMRAEPISILSPVTSHILHNGRKYKVDPTVASAPIAWEQIDFIPFLSPSPMEDMRLTGLNCGPDQQMVLCLYHRRRPSATTHSASYLLLMGRLSFLVTSSCIAFEHQQILEKLLALGETYLPRKTADYRAVMQDFSEDVMMLIQQHLNVEHVSIFYANKNRDTLSVVATTGLWDAEGHKLSQTQKAKVSYRLGENRTGEVFRTGTPFVSRLGEDISALGIPKVKETASPEHSVPWVIYPILAHHERSDLTRVLGVIRCAGNPDNHGVSRHLNFTTVQLRKLAYIAQEVGPVYELLVGNIARETAVSVTKHDLQVQPVMLEFCSTELRALIERVCTGLRVPIQTLARLAQDEQAKGAFSGLCETCLAALKRSTDTVHTRSHPEGLERGDASNLFDYHLLNLEIGATMLRNLIPQLSTDPVATASYQPSRWYLEKDILAGLVRCLRHYARITRGMTIEYRTLQKVVPSLFIDRAMVERVFCNVIVNAIKYGRRNSEIIIEPRIDSRAYYMDISNQGAGISADDRERIFHGTYRSPWAISTATGDGLGLKICRAIMQLHGGSIEVQSLAGPTTFEISFPKQLASTPFLHKEESKRDESSNY